MSVFSSYGFIIEASLIVVISYVFNLISRRTNIPSVLMLILLGILIQFELVFLGEDGFDFFPILEILGITGLIMIVLEAALDLELKREKAPLILKAFGTALLSLGASAVLLALLIKHVLDTNFFTGLLYAMPLSIISSAIVIPSIERLQNNKREFMIYESTFSDILGIMFFYFLLDSIHSSNPSTFTLSVVFNIVLTVVISIVASYLLILLFQKIRTKVKLFLLISVLMLLYSLGKLLHLSSLLIVLVFGLFLENPHIFFAGRMKKYLDKEAFSDILKNFKLITIESAFILRTFFFVIFGITITLSALADAKVLILSLIVLLMLYGVRFIFLKIFLKSEFVPELFIAPRGLISILLFFAIPQEYALVNFEQGVLLVVIIVSSIVMAISLVHHEKKEKGRESLRKALTQTQQEMDDEKDEINHILPDSQPNNDMKTN